MRKFSPSFLLIPSFLLSSFPYSVLEGSFYAKCDQSSEPFFVIVRRIFLSSWTLSKTSSFFTRSVQLISCILPSTIHDFLPISDLLSEVSKTRLHKKMYSICCMSLTSTQRRKIPFICTCDYGMKPLHSLGGHSLAFHRGGPSSIPV